ncbi:hypothetical protein Tco_0054451 [Tanacetum coccineum]
MAHSNAVMESWGSAVKTSASYNWRNSRPNFNYNSGPTFIRTVNANGPQGRPKPCKGLESIRETNFSFYCAGTSMKNLVDEAIASEEKDEEVELIVVPSAVKIPEEKDESRTSSTNSKKEETLTEPQKEKKDSSTDSLEDNPKIQAFRRDPRYTQEEGIDYDEVFAPVARIKLSDEEFMSHNLLRFIDHGHPTKEKYGYKRGIIDKNFILKRDKKDIMLVQVYVDDIIFGSTNKSCLQVKTAQGNGNLHLSGHSQEHDVVAPSQPSSSTPLVPSTSSPLVITTPTPIPANIPSPTPIPETEPKPFEHIFEEPSPVHQPSSPQRELDQGPNGYG